MALFDADDLVARCIRQSGRPAVDSQTSESDWCDYLSEAQAHWVPIIATKVPESQYGAPVQLTIAEDRKTASFGAGVVPFGKVQVYDGVGGRRLTPGDYGDPGADFVVEGDTLRAPADRTFAFPELWARFVDVGDLSIITPAVAALRGVPAREPVLQPAFARILLVYHACGLWASAGGFRDPSYFEHLEIKAAWDDPATGKPGVVTQLMSQFQDQSDNGQQDRTWWRGNPDLGNLTHRLV